MERDLASAKGASSRISGEATSQMESLRRENQQVRPSVEIPTAVRSRPHPVGRFFDLHTTAFAPFPPPGGAS